MKRIISFVLILMLVLSMVGCSDTAKESQSEVTPEQSESTQSEPEEEAVDTAALEEYNNWLASLFHGIIKLEERAGAYGEEALGGGTYFPMRFSHERIAAYEVYNSTAKIAAPYYNCTTGVRMDFYTDAKEISFTYATQGTFFDRSGEHPDDCFALFENGEFKGTYIVQYGMPEQLVYERVSEEAESRITIVFPNWHGVALSEFSLGNARPVEEYDQKFLFLGDSIAQGLFADNPSESWTHLVATEFNADYLNLAVGGEIFREAALDSGLPFEPTHIIVALGENDYYGGVNEGTMAQNCRAYLTRLRLIYPGVPVTVVSSFNSDKPESWTASMLTAARDAGCNAIEGTMMASVDADSWNVDRVHPSSKGFKEIAESLVPALNEYIK